MLVEALPACVSNEGPESHPNEHSVIWKEGNTLGLRLLSRKNRQGMPSILKRACSCPHAKSICLIHMLWEGFLAGYKPGQKPWSSISPGCAVQHMRQTLEVMHVHLCTFRSGLR